MWAKVNRSTEFKIVSELNPKKIKVVKNSNDFLNFINEYQFIDFQQNKLSNGEIEKVIGFYE